MRLPVVLAVLVPLLGLWSGCQTGDVIQKIPVAGGGFITIPLTRGGPKPGEGGGYKVSAAALHPGKSEREAFYTFGLMTDKQPDLRRVVVNDISDEKPWVLVDETDPKFENGQWKKDTEMLTPEDPRLQWIYQIPMALRVYQFKLTRTNGEEITFNHVVGYPPPIKAMMRMRWGEKY